ncbi:MAG: hypothetical protein IT305_14015 [Chloroflexi bacterium]|nr:hypothetical protein [Chloroflexota bacterium]
MSTSYLIELNARAWLDWLELPVDGPVRTIESDVGTVLAEVDKVVRVDAPSPWLAHIELQASRDTRLPSRLLQYYALLRHRHDLPVESTVVLLRQLADGPEMSGRFEQRGLAGDLTVSFHFRVVRLWEQPVEDLLSGGISVLPLAPLARVEPDDMPGIMQRLHERFDREADSSRVKELRAATQFMLGLRYDEDQIREWMHRMSWIRESSLYKVAVEEGREVGREEGRLTEVRRLVLDLGADRLGQPEPSARRAIDAIDDPERLERMLRRLFTAATWEELFTANAER